MDKSLTLNGEMQLGGTFVSARLPIYAKHEFRILRDGEHLLILAQELWRQEVVSGV